MTDVVSFPRPDPLDAFRKAISAAVIAEIVRASDKREMISFLATQISVLADWDKTA